jgi:hypothetical protein
MQDGKKESPMLRNIDNQLHSYHWHYFHLY